MADISYLQIGLKIAAYIFRKKENCFLLKLMAKPPTATWTI